MFPTFLALIIFAEVGKKPPEIVGIFKTMTDCWVVARKQNSIVERSDPLHQPDRGYVCLQMRSET